MRFTALSEISSRCARSAAIAWTRVGWRSLLIGESVGLFINLLRHLQAVGMEIPRHYFPITTVYTTVAPVLLVLAAVGADRKVGQGANAWRAYGYPLAVIAIVLAAVRAGAMLLLGSAELGEPDRPAFHAFLVHALDTMADVVFVGGAAMLAFYNRRAATRALEAVRSAELQRVELERHVIESRIETARNQIDPNEIFASLAAIRTLLQDRSPLADVTLDRLITDLRGRRTQQKFSPDSPGGSFA